jgi:hypothetical protein
MHGGWSVSAAPICRGSSQSPEHLASVLNEHHVASFYSLKKDTGFLMISTIESGLRHIRGVETLQPPL